MIINGLFIRKNNKIFLQSQYVIAAALTLTTLTRGSFKGWEMTSVPFLRTGNSFVQMNDAQLSWLLSSSYLGVTISALPVGILIDKYNFKKILLYNELLSLTSWLLLYLAKYFQHWQLLVISRFMAGIWVSIQCNIIPLYIREIAETRVRGLLYVMYQSTLRISNLYALVIGLFVPLADLPVVFITFTVIFLLLLPTIPELPQYLLKNNNAISATESLKCIRPGKTDIEIETELNEMNEYIQKEAKNVGTISNMVATKHNRKILLIAITFSGLLIVSNTSSIISYLSISLPEVKSISTIKLVILIEMIRTISSFVTSLIFNKLGGRILIITAAILSGVLLLIAGLWYHLASKEQTNFLKEGYYSYIPFICFLLQNISHAGIDIVYIGFIPVYFPMNIKGKGLAVTTAFSQMLLFFLNKMYLEISKHYGLQANFWFMSANCFLLGIFSYWFLVETKGKTLQEIQDDLRPGKDKKLIDIKL